MRAGMYLGIFAGRRCEKLTDLLDAREVSEPGTSRTRSENHAMRRVFHVRFESKNLAARFSVSSQVGLCPARTSHVFSGPAASL